MERVNIPFFYELGAVLRPIISLDSSATKIRVWITAITLKTTIKELIDRDLVVTRRPAETLLATALEIENEWGPEDFETEMEWKYERLINALAKAARDLEAVALAELQTLPAFSVTKKGAYESIALVEQADQHLLEETRARLDDAVLRDVKESGRCLALDSPTASGFHMMRAVERVTHDYWIACCSPEQDVQTKREALGEYVKRLRASDDSHAKEVVELLDQIRGKHRNLLLHANDDNFLEPSEAFSLFHIGMTVIMVMASNLPARAPTTTAQVSQTETAQSATGFAVRAGGSATETAAS